MYIYMYTHVYVYNIYRPPNVYQTCVENCQSYVHETGWNIKYAPNFYGPPIEHAVNNGSGGAVRLCRHLSKDLRWLVRRYLTYG